VTRRIHSTVFSSFHELMQSCGVRRPSVRLSVCPSVCKLLRKSLLLTQTWQDRHQTCTRWSPTPMVPRRARIQGVLKVKVKVKGHVKRTLVISRKSLLLAAGSRPNLHMMVPRRACIQGRAYFKRGVQPKCVVQTGKSGVQNL